ncbi:MAG TPA: hypothetical protein VJL34_07920, partial [Anaerolineales bacterium]|nr:hypothetical protein [Anaerolineales bacterium]
NGVVSCYYTQLLPGASQTITLVGEVSAAMVGSMDNQASVAADTFDTSTVNNTATASVFVTPEIVLPTVSWLSPVSDEGIFYITRDIMHEIIRLEAQASDNVQIEQVRLYRYDVTTNNYVDIAIFTNPPYVSNLDPAVLHLFWNQVFVKAYDSSGNESERKRILLFKYLLLHLPVAAR